MQSTKSMRADQRSVATESISTNPVIPAVVRRSNPFRYVDPVQLVLDLKSHGSNMPAEVLSMFEEALDEEMPGAWRALVYKSVEAAPAKKGDASAITKVL